MSRTRRSATLVACALVTSALVAPPPAAAGSGGTPRIRLVPTQDVVTVLKYGRGPVQLDLGVYLAALDAPFEIRVRRPDYDHPVHAAQILRTPGGAVVVRLPDDVMDGGMGLQRFFDVQIEDRAGTLLRSGSFTFCPNGYDQQRVSDTGPVLPRYPEFCWWHPFALGTVWGVDEGWAVQATSYDRPIAFRLREGRYVARISIAARYAELFGVAPEDAAAEVRFRVVRSNDCFDCVYRPRTANAGGEHGRRRLTAAPASVAPNPDTLPDLVALPSFGISVGSRRHRDVLSFGAHVWNRGPSPLVVEGFRRPGESIMDAYQYFTRHDRVVGRASVGAFEFDTRRGHQHWHFEQFARYRLLDATGLEVVRSRKQSFCLAPTDPIDLTVRGATWRPGQLGFSACGGPTALWIRETLPVGWGDTYYQGVPGQWFDITGLPNGTYLIEVAANPLGLLYDRDPSNDTETREIVLGGQPGARTVTVPPWHGIDSEGGLFF